MRASKIIKKLKNAPFFPAITLVPTALVLSDAVLTVLNFSRLKRLEKRARRP